MSAQTARRQMSKGRILGFSVLSGIGIATLLVTPTIGRLDQPSVRFYETPVSAAERYIRAYYDFDVALMADFERYAMSVISDTRVRASMFDRAAIEDKSIFSTKPLHTFSESLAGAYLTTADMIYLKRLQAILEKEREDQVHSIMGRLRDAQSSADESGRTETVDGLSRSFFGIPKLARAVRDIPAAGLQSFAKAFREKLEAQAVSSAVVDAALRRPEEYRAVYEENKKDMIAAAFSALDGNPILERIEGEFRDTLKSFLVSESCYGLEHYENVPLARKGVYELIGSDSLEEFRGKLRDALLRAAT